MEPQVSHHHLTHYLRDKYHKALTRFEKGLESGRFASYSKQKKAQIWNRLNRYAKQLGIALRPGLIAACLAAGLCFSSAASAQTFVAQTGAANPCNGVDVGNNSGPRFVDIDGDGDMDAFSGETNGTILYYKNTGTTTAPVLAAQIGVNNPLNGVDVGSFSFPSFVDIDGDGDKDAFIGEQNGTILYYKNTGTTTAPVFAAQTGANNSFNGVDVGTFSFPAFVDIDGDGDQDAFIGEQFGTIKYYKNTGTPTAPVFVQQTGANNPAAGLGTVGYSAPSFEDIDGDGDKDAFVGETNGIIWYYKNIGTPTAPVFVQLTGAYNPFDGVDVGFLSTPTFVDIDGDGDQDAFIGEQYGTIKYYNNIGAPTVFVFGEQTGAANPFNGVDVGNNSTPSFVDIDGDGDQDAFSGSASNGILYYKNTGTITAPVLVAQTATNNPFNGLTNGFSFVNPRFVDIDGDGDQDAFIGEQNGTILYYKNTGTPIAPVFAVQTGANNPFNGVDVGDYSNATFEDIDGDGDQDAFTGGQNGITLYYKNTGTPTAPVFVQQTGANNIAAFLGVVGFSTPSFVDIDQDGDKDVFVGETNGIIRYYKNIGTPTAPVFVQVTGVNNPFDGVDVGGLSTPTFVDIDGDGNQDAFSGEQYGTIKYYQKTLNTEVPKFGVSTNAANPFNGVDVGNNSGPIFVDIDGDGDQDAFSGGQSGTIQYYKNTGTTTAPVFAAQTGANNPLNGVDVGFYSTPTFEDIDGDGDQDAFIGEKFGTILYYQNIGTTTAPVFAAQTGANNPFDGVDVGSYSTPTFVDIDGDGDQDAFIGSSNGTIRY